MSGQTPFRTRTPHDPPGSVAIETLLDWWLAARRRTFLAEHASGHPETLDAADYLTELALGSRIAAEATNGRWAVVARLLTTGTVEDWHLVGEAIGVTGEEAAAGFTSWLTSQAALYRSTGLGLTAAEVSKLVRLADSLPN
ncbi:hypothetical protein [Umezawaea sp. Da 62-37]|uniref:hypothetical protein n=1 Tax=Umezawaea sp. Da 62-37 TaxID=3075927 RepID=UPI0028F7454B|nr:hypothetical protein [Umezawaea sp. Da 62-37]WNV89033.1 hypothetical protein RM788_12240 [Umezawaea sp. Da 62-37]